MSYHTFLFGLVAALSALPLASEAQTITLRADDRAKELLGGNVDLAAARIESQINTEAQALLGANDTKSILEASANVQSLVNKGLGADYSLLVDGLVFGLGVSVGLGANDQQLEVVRDTTTDETTAVPAGAGAQLSLLLGYNFSSAGLPWLTLYAHGMSAPVNVSDLRGSFYNLGASAQFRIVGPVGNAWAGWRGLALTTGIEASETRIDLTPADALDLSMNVGNIRIASASGSGIELVQRSLTVPFELTTSVHLLRSVTLYTGLGLDLNFGRASLNANLDTTVSGTSGTPGTMVVAFDDGADPDRAFLRFLAGAQADLGVLDLFTQINARPGNETVSVAAGLRLMF